jgi:hypothetical protein
MELTGGELPGKVWSWEGHPLLSGSTYLVYLSVKACESVSRTSRPKKPNNGYLEL